MNSPRTTICGAVAAAAVAIGALPSVTGTPHLVAVAIGAAATAMLGFFAVDASAQKPLPKTLPVFMWGGLALTLLAGCTIAGLHATATIPSFGVYDVSLAGGTIGNRPNTNNLSILIAPTITNQPPTTNTNK